MHFGGECRCGIGAPEFAHEGFCSHDGGHEPPFVITKELDKSSPVLWSVLTNNENNRVIGLTLQFYQIQYPVIRIGPGELYDFYQLRTKITRRTLE